MLCRFEEPPPFVARNCAVMGIACLQILSDRRPALRADPVRAVRQVNVRTDRQKQALLPLHRTPTRLRRPVGPNHPTTYSIREERILGRRDNWLTTITTPITWTRQSQPPDSPGRFNRRLRVLVAQIAAAERWGQVTNRAAATAKRPACEVRARSRPRRRPGSRRTGPQGRPLMRAHMLRMARRSAQARQRRSNPKRSR